MPALLFLFIMLKDLENITFRFYAVDKSKWEEIIYNAADLMEAIRNLPDDKEGTDYKATALHEATQLLEASFFNIVEPPNCICIGEDCEFFDKFLPHMKQDEQCLKAEHAGWAWGTDYPMSWGIIDMQRMIDIMSELFILVSTPADKLSKQVKSVDYVVNLYNMLSQFHVKDDQIIVWYAVYEEPDNPWDC